MGKRFVQNHDAHIRGSDRLLPTSEGGAKAPPFAQVCAYPRDACYLPRVRQHIQHQSCTNYVRYNAPPPPTLTYLLRYFRQGQPRNGTRFFENPFQHAIVRCLGRKLFYLQVSQSSVR
jgi:hypothetical protein